jgi:polar amino acid transport system substrate-binding protein
MEVDLVNALGAKVEIVKVNSANRFESLAQGQIDLMIASATDTGRWSASLCAQLASG